jgi:hypothetical protein
MSYDQWKTRSDRDDEVQWDEAEEEQMDEDELAIHDAEMAFDVLVERYGYERSSAIFTAIIRDYGRKDMTLKIPEQPK